MVPFKKKIIKYVVRELFHWVVLKIDKGYEIVNWPNDGSPCYLCVRDFNMLYSRKFVLELFSLNYKVMLYSRESIVYTTSLFKVKCCRILLFHYSGRSWSWSFTKDGSPSKFYFALIDFVFLPLPPINCILIRYLCTSLYTYW